MTIIFQPIYTKAAAGTVTGYEKVTWGIHTANFYVNGIHALCVQYNKLTPAVGTTIESIVPCTNEVLRKALYYGYNGPANTLGTDARAQVLTAIAVSDANIGEAATGVSTKYDEFYWDIVNNPSKYPSPPNSFKTYIAITVSEQLQNLAFYVLENNGFVKAIKTSSNTELTDGNSCYAIEGAQYGIYSSESLSESSRVGTLTMDANGNSNIVELAPGIYYAYELVAPKGYAQSTEVIQFRVTSEETLTINLVDDPQVNSVEILLKKVDAETGLNKPQGSATLQGAQFNVKYYAGLWEADVDPETLGQAPDRTWMFETDEEGMVYFKESYKVSGDELYQGLPLGTITIQETKASEGYRLNDTVFVRQITSEGMAEYVTTYSPPVIPEEILKVEVTKYQIGTDIPIPGTVFEHKKPDGSTEILTTDENGQLSFKGLAYGVHEIREISVTDGYLCSDEVFTFTVNETTNKDISITVYDDLSPYDVMIHKTDYYENALEGAEFILYSDAECQNEVMKGVTGTDGKLRLQNLKVENKYYLKETKAPAGYQVPLENGKEHVYEIYALSTPVNNEFTVYIDGVAYDSNSDGMCTLTGTKANREVNIKIINELGYVLPDTGSCGTLLMTIAGTSLCSISIYLTQKERRKKEKNNMKKFSKLVTALTLSLAMVVGMGVSAFAASESATVDIEIKATTMNVTVPSSVPIVFNADGTNTYPTNWKITNNSKISQIYLASVSVDGSAYGWDIIGEDSTVDIKRLAADTKDIKFYMGLKGDLKQFSNASDKTATAATASVSYGNSIAIAAEGTQVIEFEVERCSFTSSHTSATAFDMTLEYAF